jgi:hypothetical protein
VADGSGRKRRRRRRSFEKLLEISGTVYFSQMPLYLFFS